MFGRKQNTESKNNTSNVSKSPSSSSSNSACVIVKGTVIEGDFYSKSDTRLDGVINGKVTCDARLIMGVEAIIEGTATCKDAKIAGSFSGDLTIERLLSLGNSAKVDGNINAAQLEVDEGALLNGDIAVGKFEKK